MNIALFCAECNNFLALPSTLIFLIVSLILTYKTGFIQFKSWGKFIKILKSGPAEKSHNTFKSISSTQALFTAMSTTIGIGNVVGPSLAIAAGGPGALFWLIIYSLFGCVTKFVEVTLAITTRSKTVDGHILGGPSKYLALIHQNLGKWYAVITIPLFIGWSSIQSNILADILYQESISKILTGLVLGGLVFLALNGGAKRVSSWATKIVPMMFVLYILFAALILIKMIDKLPGVIRLIFTCAFQPTAAIGGFLGATIFESIRHGVYKGIFITESGIGTSAIPHALADVEKPTDQALLAMYSVAADTILCLISGLLVLVTGSWWHKNISNVVVYQAFKNHAPYLGQIVLLISIALFVFTTTIGNAFNGSQSLATLTKHRYLKIYAIIAALATAVGAMLELPIIWNICDILLTLVAIPNCLGVLYVYLKSPQDFVIK
jgi:AGCS family alanine or glycine:cation symporter